MEYTQSMEFSRPAYWSGLPFPSSVDLPSPGIEPRSPALQVDSLPATREAQELKSGDEMEGMRVPPLDASRTPCKENLPSVPPLSPTSWRGTSKLETPERKMISVRRWCCHCLAAKSSLTLAAPWTVCSPSGSSVHGISQARIVKWVYHFFLPTQGSNPSILHWQADSLPLSHQGSLWGDQLSIIL